MERRSVMRERGERERERERGEGEGKGERKERDREGIGRHERWKEVELTTPHRVDGGWTRRGGDKRIIRTRMLTKKVHISIHTTQSMMYDIPVILTAGRKCRGRERVCVFLSERGTTWLGVAAAPSQGNLPDTEKCGKQ